MDFRFLTIWLAAAGFAAEHTPPAVQPATSFPAMEVHPDEHVAIAVEPYDTKEKESIFRIDYIDYDVMPVRLIVTNLGDKPISLRDARILFETARRRSHPGRRTRRRGTYDDAHQCIGARQFPSPLRCRPSIPRPRAVDTRVQQDFDTFEYSALAVEPHTTRAGFLFYDITGLSNPLVGAKLYVRSIRDCGRQRAFLF